MKKIHRQRPVTMKRMSKPKPAGRARPDLQRVLIALCILATGLSAFVAPREAAAASPQLKTPAERVVLGTVQDAAGTPLDKAVVYLQDTKTMVIRSYVTNGGGHFHFNQLSPDTDYEVWAEVNKHRSKSKIVSMFSSHLKFMYTLKIKS